MAHCFAAEGVSHQSEVPLCGALVVFTTTQLDRRDRVIPGYRPRLDVMIFQKVH